MSAILEARGLTVGYGELAVARGLDVRVEPGRVMLILGPNGAGKTTTLLTLAGALRPLSGEVRLAGECVTSPLHRRVQQGLAFVPDERGAITRLTVDENLRLGPGDPARAFELFPELRDHRKRRAGLLSGGQQKMLALALALSGRPKVLLADELSLGLAPRLVDRLLDVVRGAASDGVGVVLVEQHAHQALDIADDVVLLARGKIEMSGPVSEIRSELDRVLATGYLTVNRHTALAER
jgi:ABC-type branched-subunit amino acid transport system ATPase component